MGAGFVRSIQAVVPSVAPGSAWAQRDIGPTLRRFFGAFYNGDVWAVYRRYKNIDVENTGWISYEDLAEILFLPEFNLLFIFDAFSQQNALIDARELLVMVCLFSSSKLSEKCGATLALQVLGRCTGAPVRAKDVAVAMQDELSDVLPLYREAVNRLGSEATFKEERIFGQDEVDEICSTFRPVYDDLPIGQDPPPNCVAPPAPDWEKTANAAVTHSRPATSQVRQLNRTLTEVELHQMALLGGLGHADEDEDREQAAEILKEKSMIRQKEIEEKEAAKAAIQPARGWMIIHGADFVSLSKDINHFRHLFVKCVAQALDVPSGVITIVDITPGSVVVEFLVHPSMRGGDRRTAVELLIALAEHIINGKSVLRRGHFRDYAASAELLVGETRKTAVRPLSITDGIICCDQAVQCCNPQAVLEEVLARLDTELKRAEAAEERCKEAVADLRRRDESVTALKKHVKLARQQEEEQKEVERDAEMKEFGEQLRRLEEIAKQRHFEVKEDQHDKEVTEFKEELDHIEEQQRRPS